MESFSTNTSFPTQAMNNTTTLMHQCVFPFLTLPEVASIIQTCKSTHDLRHIAFRAWATLSHNSFERNWTAAVAAGIGPRPIPSHGAPPLLVRHRYRLGRLGYYQDKKRFVPFPRQIINNALLAECLRLIPFNLPAHIPGGDEFLRENQMRCAIMGEFALHYALRQASKGRALTWKASCVDIYVLNCPDPQQLLQIVWKFTRTMHLALGFNLDFSTENLAFTPPVKLHQSYITISMPGDLPFFRFFHHQCRSVRKILKTFPISVERTILVTDNHGKGLWLTKKTDSANDIDTKTIRFKNPVTTAWRDEIISKYRTERGFDSLYNYGSDKENESSDSLESDSSEYNIEMRQQ